MTRLCFLVLPLACSGAAVGPSGDRPAETDARLEVLEIADRPGTYVVPHVSGELAAHASYPVDRVLFRANAGGAVLRYKMPRDLTGRSAWIDLAGGWNASNDRYELRGDAGDARCTTSAEELRCDEHLPGIRVDVAEIAGRFGPTHPRATIASTFAGDPIGVLVVPRR
jgi:hypothetical protein